MIQLDFGCLPVASGIVQVVVGMGRTEPSAYASPAVGGMAMPVHMPGYVAFGGTAAFEGIVAFGGNVTFGDTVGSEIWMEISG